MLFYCIIPYCNNVPPGTYLFSYSWAVCLLLASCCYKPSCSQHSHTDLGIKTRISLWYTTREWIARSYSMWLCNFTRHDFIILQRGCTNFHSHQWFMSSHCLSTACMIQLIFSNRWCPHRTCGSEYLVWMQYTLVPTTSPILLLSVTGKSYLCRKP